MGNDPPAADGTLQPGISAEAWANGSETFVHRGHRIFVKQAGLDEAEPLLLIHGFPTSSWDWEALWPQLARQYRLLTLDLIGFGYSAKPNAYDYSTADQADLIEGLLRDRSIHAYHILAHDYGDTVAQELLARQHDGGDRPTIRSIAFLNGGLFPEVIQPIAIQKLLLSPIGALVALATNKFSFARSMRRIFGANTQPGVELLDGFWSLMRRHGGRRVIHRIIRYMRERHVRRERWVGAMQAATIPLTLIDGAADPISGLHLEQHYRALIANPDTTVLHGIGHYPQLEAPQAVLDAYRSFRDRCSGRTERH